MKRPEAGYALIVILLMATLVLIALSAAVPRVLTQGQREKEEELLFRGRQYQRAIGLFYKKFGRYPTKIEELLETNERAFLRREFADPMTPGGEWRLMRVGPLGELMGSAHERQPLGQPSGASSSEQEQPPAAPGSGTTSSAGTSGGSGSQPIAGVASTSTARSIRVYEGYDVYNQWEFIYDPVKEALQNRPAVPGQQQPDGLAQSQPSDSPR
jgi:type II secretory pathway pseudopilin PulG